MLQTLRSFVLAATLWVLLLAGPLAPIGVGVAQADVQVEEDVAYGEADGQPLLLDVYRPPARDTPRPAVILIHGGGWTAGYGSRADMAQPARELADAGYVAFTIAYRLLDGEPGHNVWPAQLADVQRAVRWVRANADRYGVDPERICSYGHSAGGHLAAMLGVRDTRDNSDPALADVSSRVNCVVDLAGDMDLAIPYPNAVDTEIVTGLLGGAPEEAPDAYSDASPLAQVDEETVPFLIFHGQRDTINPIEHSRRMVAALHEAGVEVVYVEIPDADHFTWGTWSAVGPFTLVFLERHLTPAR